MSGASGIPYSFLFPEILETSVPNETQSQISQVLRQHENGIIKKKYRSAVWKDFDKYKDEDGNAKAKCKACGRLFNGSSEKGTTHLKNHFRICKRKRNGTQPAQSEPTGQLNHLEEMRRLIMQEDLELINGTNIHNFVNLYNYEKENLRNFLQDLSCRVCLTVQEWDERYLVAVWFIDDNWKLKNIIIGFRVFKNLKEDVRNMILEWRIENKLSYVIFRSYSRNIRRDCILNRDRDSSSSIFPNWHLDICSIFAEITEHVNSRVRNFLWNMKKIIFENDNYRSVIDVATNVQVDIDLLIGGTWLYDRHKCDGAIVYLCQLNNLLHLKETLHELSKTHLDLKNLRDEDWDLIRDICLCFEDEDFLLKYCKDEQTANTHFFFSISMWKCFIKLKKFIATVNVNEWYEFNRVLAMATVLDPRFGMEKVKEWYKKIFDDEWKKEYKIFEDYVNGVYREYVKGMNQELSKESDHAQMGCLELNRYLQSIPVISSVDFDILKWWRDNAQNFPTLTKMCRDFLSIRISTSIPAFDFFNDRGWIDISEMCLMINPLNMNF